MMTTILPKSEINSHDMQTSLSSVLICRECSVPLKQPEKKVAHRHHHDAITSNLLIAPNKRSTVSVFKFLINGSIKRFPGHERHQLAWSMH